MNTKSTGLEWYYKNKEKSIAQSTSWRKRNPEKYNESRRKRYAEKKEQRRAEMREYYYKVRKPFRLANPIETKTKDRANGLKRIAKLRNFIQVLKVEKGGRCVSCGYAEEPRILQFHHINGKKDKLGNISEMKSMKKIQEEAQKCDLLCPNCHSLEHLC